MLIFYNITPCVSSGHPDRIRTCSLRIRNPPRFPVAPQGDGRPGQNRTVFSGFKVQIATLVGPTNSIGASSPVWPTRSATSLEASLILHAASWAQIRPNLVPPTGIEPVRSCLEGRCLIQSTSAAYGGPGWSRTTAIRLRRAVAAIPQRARTCSGLPRHPATPASKAGADWQSRTASRAEMVYLRGIEPLLPCSF